MKRSSLKRTPFKPKTLRASQSAKSRFGFKSKPRKKIDGYHDKRYLDACMGQPCYLQVQNVCGGWAAKDTVVPAHSNQSKHGKGMGIKARDTFTVPGCMWCHQWIDQNDTGATKQEKFSVWNAAYSKWLPERIKLIGD